MLQQTQVSTVLGYFDRFMAALPDVEALAAAAEDEVLHLWTGLGYYSRARNLHKTAQIVVERHAGEFPATSSNSPNCPASAAPPLEPSPACRWACAHRSSTATSSAYWRATWRRDGYPGEPKVARALWEAAERFTPHARVNHYTQAMMDLGATLHRAAKPSCLLLPAGLRLPRAPARPRSRLSPA